MQRTDRLFELIQVLRQATKPMTSAALAERLEVSQRTIYRDIVTLQSMRVPIDGEVGVGYVMARDYDLPPLNFAREEVEAIVVGLSLLARTGDVALQKAAGRVLSKIDVAKVPADTLGVSNWGIRHVDPVLMETLREVVREERKIKITYLDLDDVATHRTVLPLSVTYYVKVAVLSAWCELRSDFRHFRIDRLQSCEPLDAFFPGDGAALRAQLHEIRAAEEDG
ncbi:MAG: YafY family protein [Pseudomonadota bacterium]